MQDDHSRTEVERALARILADDKFACAPQMSAFLAYVVRQTLEGRAERIKAYTIGIEALGKPESFDSQTDPSVRVLAKRLRTCLVAYHERHPEASPVIEIRPGCYRPLFLSPAANDAVRGASTFAVAPGSIDEQAFRNAVMHAREPRTGAAGGTPLPAANGDGRVRPTLPAVRLTDAYRPGSGGAALAAVAAGVLAHADRLQVIRHSRDETTTWPEDYTLSLEAIESGESLRVELQLVRATDGLVVHAHTCHVDLDRDEITRTGEELPPQAIVQIERFASMLAREDGPLLRDYRAQTPSNGRSEMPHKGTAPMLERPLALEAARYPTRNGSPLADAA